MGVCKLKEGGGALPKPTSRGWVHSLQWWLLQLPPKGLAVLQTDRSQKDTGSQGTWRKVPGSGDLGVAGGPHPAAELRESGLGQGTPPPHPGELPDGGRWESAIDPGSEILTVS